MTESKKKILLVEDDKFITDIYSTKLKELKYEVKTAGNGKEALKLLKDFKPDLILLDVIMPKMDGFGLLDYAKKEKSLKDIPIVLLTNVSEDANVKKGLKKGAKDYLVKHYFRPSEVVEKIKEYIK